jgi:L-fuculose-phosphate aldolase
MSAVDIGTAVVEAALEMERCGLVVGTAGNVSARRPDGTVCLTPSSTPYGDITVDGLAVVDLDGEVVAGGNPTTEKAMHLACYRSFPEVGGVVHCHPLHASMFAVAGAPIPAVIEEVIVYVGGDIPCAEYRRTGSDELAAEAVLHLADRSAVLLRNHGMLCVGKSVDDALHTAKVVEHTAHIVWGAHALGGPAPLPEKTVTDFEGIYAFVRKELWSPTTQTGDG